MSQQCLPDQIISMSRSTVALLLVSAPVIMSSNNSAGNQGASNGSNNNQGSNQYAHMNGHRADNQWSFVCGICPLNFSTAANRDAHRAQCGRQQNQGGA